MTVQNTDNMARHAPRPASVLVRFGLWTWVLASFATFIYQFADLIGPALSVLGL